MPRTGGLGAALAQGAEGIQQGEDRAFARERASIQNQKLKQEVQQGQYQESLQKTPEQIAEENKVLLQQTTELGNKLSKQDTFKAFHNFNLDGSTNHINKVLRNPSVNQSFSSQIPQFVKIHNVSDINLNSDEDMALLRKHGLSPDVIEVIQNERKLMKNRTADEIKAAGLDPEHDGFNRFIKVQGEDENGNPSYELVDMYETFAKTGYLNELDGIALDKQLKRSKIKKAQATAGSSLTQVAADERDRLAAVEAGTFPADGSLKEFQDQQKFATKAKIGEASKERKAVGGTPIKERQDSEGNIIEPTPFEIEMSQGEGTFKAGLRKSVNLDNPTGEFEARLARAKTLQGKTKLPTKLDGELTDKSNSLASFYTVLDKANTLKFDRDAFTKVKDSVAKVGLHGKWNQEEAEKFMNKTSFDSELEMVMAQFVKDMSGAAVTEQERAMYASIVSAGKYSTKEAMVAALSGFINGVKTRHESNLDGIASEYPHSYIIKKRDYLRQSKKFKDVATIKQTREKPSQIASTSDAGDTFESYSAQLQKDGVTTDTITKEQRDKLASLKGK